MSGPVQERVAPLLTALAADSAALSDGVLQSRLRSVHARRTQSSEMLEEALAFARESLRETNLARGRAAQIAPVYGSMAAVPRRSVSFVG